MRASGNFLFAIRAGQSKFPAMSMEQIESAIKAMPPEERAQFADWFDAHRDELVAGKDDDLSEAQKAELLARRREYDEHPERFARMDKQALDQMFGRIRKNVAARLSSAR